jgi:predicted Zn-dependent protease
MMKTHRIVTFVALLLSVVSACAAPGSRGPQIALSPLVDDIAAARHALEQARAAVRNDTSTPAAARVQRMTDLGMWEEVAALLARLPGHEPSVRLAEAELLFQRHRYDEAAARVERVLEQDPENRPARLLEARLQVQAWELDAALRAAERLLSEERRDAEAALLTGRIHLLRKDYDKALRWAKRVQRWDPRNASAYLLEADVRFWDQDPAGAEEPLLRALALDPFDPDARFDYGYAIWRRVDATQLDAMAAQWNLALEVDPLHYRTHWHWGNGHTHLTYADYAHPTDSIVRARLAPADSLISRGRIVEAIALTRQIEREYPESVLPAMLRGSAFYLAQEMDRGARLDSAQAAFQSILERKQHYGPAHNGLAAVIKQRQFRVLASFDSLETAIAATPLPYDRRFQRVFPDVGYYPGNRVQKMIRRQLGPSIAYVPLVERQERTYRIPPLHKDLAEVMGEPYFRTATTFDNRQWMDIRGVGSGAAAIEYVERGSHQERNVLLHEYVHLFHGIVFTDAESRRVRELYYAAMREGRTLDYYAANNESEFLGQAYPAFFSPVKVHPLTHKAMNTRGDLWQKDRATFAFVDSLVQRQRAYLAGDSSALASNWAQVYVNLSERARQDSGEGAAALLDTALVWDAQYRPAMLSYAALLRDQGRFAEAERWLARAESLDPSYAPIYQARAELIGARAREEGWSGEQALERQAALYRRALSLERDLAIRAELNEDLRTLYLRYARLPEAIRVAEEYVAAAPTLSTYLRDRRDEAAALAHELRAAAGYASETLEFYRALVGQKPQDYRLRAQYADALMAAGRLDEALATLEEAQLILRAGGSENAALLARIAEIRLLEGDTAAARAAVEPILNGRAEAAPADLRLVRVLMALGQTTEANKRLGSYTANHPRARAEVAYTRGWIHRWRGDDAAAERRYREALAANPYHRRARLELIGLLKADGRHAEAAELAQAAGSLPLPLGPDFYRTLDLAALETQ